MLKRAFALLCLLALAGGACARPSAAEERLFVLAAASLRDVAVELARVHERRAGVRVEFEFAGSGLLAQQLCAGVRADVFLPAGPQPMQRVEDAGLVDPETRVDWLGNQLVVVQPVAAESERVRWNGPADLFDARLGRVALAHTEAVPAGVYARAWLASIGPWDALAPRVVPARDVRAALALVESGAVGAGVVYATDVLPARRVRVVHRVARGEGPRIVYPAAVLAEARAPAAARELLRFLVSDEAREILRRHGFLPATD